MQAPDVERWERVQSRLAEKKISALVCRLTENVVMLSGYWPILGRSVVIFPAEGKPVLLAPVSETGEAERGWIADVRPFRLYRIGDIDPEASIAKLLGQVFAERHSAGEVHRGSAGQWVPQCGQRAVQTPIRDASSNGDHPDRRWISGDYAPDGHACSG